MVLTVDRPRGAAHRRVRRTDTEPFLNVNSVVFHGRTIVTRGHRPGPVRGVYTSGPQYLAGQSGHGRGPVLLDWQTVRTPGRPPRDRRERRSYHEFAHKLDQLDGAADGMPPLPDRETREAWVQTLGTNYRRLRRRGPDGLVRGYGATNPAEYFAVTSELFFTRPDRAALSGYRGCIAGWPTSTVKIPPSDADPHVPATRADPGLASATQSRQR